MGRLEVLMDEIGADDFGFPLPHEQTRAVRKLDPTPIVGIGENETVVRGLGFTK